VTVNPTKVRSDNPIKVPAVQPTDRFEFSRLLSSCAQMLIPMELFLPAETEQVTGSLRVLQPGNPSRESPPPQ
jgi:hypothetical protein